MRRFYAENRDRLYGTTMDGPAVFEKGVFRRFATFIGPDAARLAEQYAAIKTQNARRRQWREEMRKS